MALPNEIRFRLANNPTNDPIVSGGVLAVQVDQDCPAGARLRIVNVDGVMLKGQIET